MSLKNIIFSFVITAMLFISQISFSQIKFPGKLKLKESSGLKLSDIERRDTNEITIKKSGVEKINVGGLFLSPSLGLAIPVGTFGNQSGEAFIFGLKLEFGFNKFYPFVFSGVYETQKNSGAAGFMSANLLQTFNTIVNSFGGSVDIILNKYLRSSFTIPVLSLEVKYSQVKREVLPLANLPEGILLDENLITYAAGLGFTIYVFDISGKYTFAESLSQISFQMRIHIPLIKF